MPMWALIEVLSTIEAGLARISSSAWTRKKGPFRLTATERSKSASSVERPEVADSGVDEQNVETAALERRPRPLSKLPRRPHRRGLTARSRVRCGAASSVSRLLPVMATRAAFFEELARSFESDAAGATRDQGAFAAESVHGDVLGGVTGVTGSIAVAPPRCRGDGTSSALELDFRSWNSSLETPNNGRIDAWVKSTTAAIPMAMSTANAGAEARARSRASHRSPLTAMARANEFDQGQPRRMVWRLTCRPLSIGKK